MSQTELFDLPEPQWVKAVEAYQRLGSYAAAGAELGVSRGTVYNHVQRHREERLGAGEVPEGYKVKGLSTSRDKHGNVVRTTRQVAAEPLSGDPVMIDAPIHSITTARRGDGMIERQWVRQRVEDQTRAEHWKMLAEQLGRTVDRAAIMHPLPPDVYPEKRLCSVYPIGDHHVGMMAWGMETRGENYDLKIAEQLLARASEYLMRAAPPSQQAVLAFMGDFVHFDSYKPVTPASGHFLDADSRFPRVARVAVRMIRHMIEAALRYHDKVHVVFLPGNHDPAVSELINVLLSEIYRDEPRVTVDSSPSPFRYFEFGKNLLGFTHGDGIKVDQLPILMATDMPEGWGRTQHRLVFTGHVHHESRKDRYGVAVETVPVLIPNDAWASKAGYRSVRAMQVIVLDSEDGEVERHTYNAARFNRSIVQ